MQSPGQRLPKIFRSEGFESADSEVIDFKHRKKSIRVRHQKNIFVP